MANIWQHPSIIAAEALRHLEDSLIIGSLCTRDITSEFTTTANGWKKGDEVPFRTHGEYTVDEFSGSISTQSITTSSRSLKIEKHFDTSVEVTAREEALELDSFSEQVLRPTIYKFGETVDLYLGSKITQAAGMYVFPNLFTTAADVAQARRAAIIQQLTMDRFCLVDVDTEAVLLGQDWINQSQIRGRDGERTLRTGILGGAMGMEFYSSLGFPTNEIAHTAGTGTAVTNNATETDNQIGQTALTVDAAAGSFNAGDRLMIAGVRRPVIVKTTIPSATGVTSIELVDPITEIIPDNMAVTVIGSGLDLTYHGAIFDGRSLAMASPMLEKPADKVAAVAYSNGISLRIVKGYDINTKSTVMSIDMLLGAFMLDPRRATLLAESA